MLLVGPMAGAMADAEPQRFPSIELLLANEPAPARAGSVDWAERARASGAAGAQGLKLGLQWRGEPVAGQPVQAQLWRRLRHAGDADRGVADEPGVYGARVEMQMPPERSLSLRDLLGVQLDNGAKLSLARRNGRVSIYYKVQF
ncbi:hypothetical protein JI739_08645 [Ramlibacter sp. AW1]|uniref:Uncharacterized protein n=1 Tax=Ramlibacter aurantiacus TaxID=2801330 RepID=A0A936ZN80_9BURK|nr:hypothetical protein [Ramlibacter aurantiacus]MBL0420408.1 hypothetical protein [Ramlibacter aurantiacus]